MAPLVDVTTTGNVEVFDVDFDEDDAAFEACESLLPEHEGVFVDFFEEWDRGRLNGSFPPTSLPSAFGRGQ